MGARDIRAKFLYGLLEVLSLFKTINNKFLERILKTVVVELFRIWLGI